MASRACFGKGRRNLNVTGTVTVCNNFFLQCQVVKIHLSTWNRGGTWSLHRSARTVASRRPRHSKWVKSSTWSCSKFITFKFYKPLYSASIFSDIKKNKNGIPIQTLELVFLRLDKQLFFSPQNTRYCTIIFVIVLVVMYQTWCQCGDIWSDRKAGAWWYTEVFGYEYLSKNGTSLLSTSSMRLDKQHFFTKYQVL